METWKMFLKYYWNGYLIWTSGYKEGGWGVCWGGGGGAKVPAINISKAVGCMAIKFLQVDGMLNPNIYLSRHYDVISGKNVGLFVF